ncbi:MAG: hypothetical protein EHM58_15815 [Ignavibacteriae bacterium]|nr:MAG: hypothetical protein EHM58_15815 [Ignavibacteriota bacterium]
MKFKCSMDKITRRKTIWVAFVCSVVIIGNIINIIYEIKTSNLYNSYFIASFVLIISAIRIFRKPLCYEITDNTLKIKRLAGDINIPFMEIYSADYNLPEEYNVFKRCRVIIDGIFYWGAKIYLPNIGIVRLYATQFKNFLFIETANHGIIVLSPDDATMKRFINHNGTTAAKVI